ncbi:MAG: thiamine pyrophosphate-binding protein [Opitutales bacterium]|nr:thiamine pyrophosphate-binding protein [Opitutales bacterium]
MKVTDYLVDFFASLGVKVIFGYQGGMITHFVDSISKSPSIRFVQTYHEQSAAIAAEGYARESGKIGVAISTSGPGATNMVTGIANAFFDSIPVVYITGQVNTYEYNYEKKVKQIGFQETDIVSIVRPITKYAVMISDPKVVQDEFSKAVSIALSGRKGPVLLDLPMNIQRADIEVHSEKLTICPASLPCVKRRDVDKAYRILMSAKRPLVLCGGGIASSLASDSVNAFLNKTGLPYVVSLMGKGTVDESQESFVGMIGSYGNRDANIVLSQSDVVLVLGSRLDLRQTGSLQSGVFDHITFIHVDIDRGELERSTPLKKVCINSDVGDFVRKLFDVMCNYVTSSDWLSFVNRIKGLYSQDKELSRFVLNKAPYAFVFELNKQFLDDTIYTIDIGQNQMWAAQCLRIKNRSSFYTSGGLAPMGYSLHAAIGAAFASPGKKVVCIIGDGGFHIAIQSLLLIHQYKLNITVCVMNNGALGMITQFQELYFDSNMVGTTRDGGYLVPNIKVIAEAFSLTYLKLDEAEYKSTNIGKYNIVEFVISGATKVSPKLEFNQPLYNMTPYLSDDEIKGLLSPE